LLELSYLNEVCFLSLNTDDKKYNIGLKLAQMDLRDLLGGEFYEEIERQDSEGFTSDNDTLYTLYIKDYLAWQTYFHYLKFSQADSTPTGIRQFNDENSSVLDDVKLWSFEKNVLGVATKYKDAMINYMKLEQAKDTTKFPLWENSCKTVYSFAISAVDKSSDSVLKVNKAIITNE
jgi:hypothetical protein